MNYKKLKEKIANFLYELSYKLPSDVKKKLKKAYLEEKGRGKEALRIIVENFKISEKNKTPLCQDTGVPVFLVELSNRDRINEIKNAIAEGTKIAYRNLRKSITLDVFFRKPTFTAPEIFFEDGKRTKIKVIIKGGGCENVSALFHFSPAVKKETLVNEIVEYLRINGINSCPPLFIGIGMGGDSLKATFLAYNSFFKKNKNSFYVNLSNEIKNKLNSSGSGPQGWGGKNFVLDVNILQAPSHIANFTVSVIPICHSLRKGVFYL